MVGFKITKEGLETIGQLKVADGIALAFQAIATIIDNCVENFKKEFPDFTEEDEKDLRAKLHDDIVISCSVIAERIYPYKQDEA